MTSHTYDAILIVSFGGPEQRADVIPFLENVTRGRNIPPERLEEVAHHYYEFGGKSPHNDQIRELIALLEQDLRENDVDLPVYWGNRNWHPMLADTMRQMAADGVKRALSFVVSAYSSYSGCRQYRENIAAAQELVKAEGLEPPSVDKVRVFYNHPGFIGPMRDRVGDAIDRLPDEHRADARLVFTAHSIPSAMAKNCAYEAQLREACALVAEVYPGHRWELVWQSRSGPPQVPWLEPDICDYLNALADEGHKAVVVVPIGFLSDHLEVLFDLDTEAKEVAAERGLHMVRAATVGTHPRFIAMIRQLIQERMDPAADRPALGVRGPNHDVCPPDCCMPGARPTRPAASS